MNNEAADGRGELSVVDSLVQLSFVIQSILGRIGADHDLSIVQIRLLGILRDREPTMLQLARHLGLDKSSVTGLIDRAERRGLVERTATPNDRRGFNVRMTAAGRELVRTAGAEIERQIMDIAASLSAAERAQFAALATRLIGAPAGGEA